MNKLHIFCLALFLSLFATQSVASGVRKGPPANYKIHEVTLTTANDSELKKRE